MGKIGSLFWEITAETSKFSNGLKETKKATDTFKSGVNEAVQGLTGFNLSKLARHSTNKFLPWRKPKLIY